jgi:hypothetical protein
MFRTLAPLLRVSAVMFVVCMGGALLVIHCDLWPEEERAPQNRVAPGPGALPHEADLHAAFADAVELRLMQAVCPEGIPGTLVSLTDPRQLRELSEAFSFESPWQGPYEAAKFASTGIRVEIVGRDGTVNHAFFEGLGGFFVYEAEEFWTREMSQEFDERLNAAYDAAAAGDAR